MRLHQALLNSRLGRPILRPAGSLRSIKSSGDNYGLKTGPRTGLNARFGANHAFHSSVYCRQLPSEKEARRNDLSRQASAWIDRLQNQAMGIVQRFHDVSGYTEIDKIKADIARVETKVNECRLQRARARHEYQIAVTERSISQREVNELLRRKHDWSSRDLERFTELYRTDHEIEQKVESTKKASADAEAEYERYDAQLSTLISSRYREEQIWSDKVRQASTWGTGVLFGLNILLFLIVQLWLEPWKRRRLVNAFEVKVKDMLDAEAATLANADHAEQADQADRAPEQTAKIVGDKTGQAQTPPTDPLAQAELAQADQGLHPDQAQTRTDQTEPGASINLETVEKLKHYLDQPITLQPPEAAAGLGAAALLGFAICWLVKST